MGQYNSSLTRVKPVFDALRARDPTGAAWLGHLWTTATATKPTAATPPVSFGQVVADAKVYERVVPPSTSFLRWAVQNPSSLNKLPPPNYGAKGAKAITMRAKLFGDDKSDRESAITEALMQIDRFGGKGSGQQWWAFEGFTHVDACFETEGCLVFVEGKRTETVSASTRWFAQRNQLWRNVEVAQELANGRAFGVILAVETEDGGRAALREAAASRDTSYPHLSMEQKRELDRHLLGFAVWSEIVAAFNLPPSVLLDT